MRIAEIYKSTQGEGLLTGTESVFVRTSGCNLRCWFCDTPFASWEPTGEDLAVPNIIRKVTDLQLDHVVVTGGEPMIWSELIPLTEQLHALGLHVTIETAGTLFLPVHCDLMSISPKLSNSLPRGVEHQRWRRRHRQTQHAPDVIRQLLRRYSYQLKFVVDHPDDLPEIESYLSELPEIDVNNVMLMPQGTDQESLTSTQEWLEPYCEQNGLRFCPRKQVEWFGFVRGT